jgi:fumarate hydratase class II
MEMPLYGPETRKALENFQISGWTMPREFLSALALIKEYAAAVNGELGEIPEEVSRAIVQAAAEIQKGKHWREFPVDVFQTGSGTSTNMNMNEVIAALATRNAEMRKCGNAEIHPLDHVNRCQSSNDVIPTAMQIACALTLRDAMLPSLKKLERALQKKAKEFRNIIKNARTHHMDAVPMRLGDEFQSYATILKRVMSNLQLVTRELCSLPLGGTAAGTGINAHPKFAKRVIERLKEETKLPLEEAEDHVAAQSFPFAALDLSSALRQLASVLQKTANDIRLGACFQELQLPELQKGSSIMPGKVNPVIPESVIQVCAEVIGADTTVSVWCAQGSTFELNTCMPLMAHRLLQSLKLLTNACNVFSERCIDGIRANEKVLKDRLEKNPMLATALAPHIGYDAAAEIAKEAMEKGTTIYEVALERTKLGERKLKRLLDPKSMMGG